MSRPLGSACCDNEVNLINEAGTPSRFACVECGQECEVVE